MWFVTDPLNRGSDLDLASEGKSSLLDSEIEAKQFAFVFTDIAESTRLLDEIGTARYYTVSEAHRRIVRAAIKRFGGTEVDTAGDAFFIAFENIEAALAAAVAMQLALASYRDLDITGLPVRIGVHTGEAVRTREGFVGLNVHRAARISAVAHGGQVVVSEETVKAVEKSTETSAPGGSLYDFRDLGRHRLKDLSEPQRLFQLIIPDLQSEFPPLLTLEAFPTNLPVQLTPFIGREREVTRVGELIRDPKVRLVTLLGPGGVGKTRLALQAAASVIEEFEDGVYFVGLASVHDPDFVLSAIAQAIAVAESGGSLFDAVINFLGTKRLLFVLDNFEHVISAATLINSLLDQAPGLRVLATSRTHLKIKGEQEYPVEPFRVPQLDRLPSVDELASFDSVSLFVDRARAVKPRFSLTTTNAQAVAGICARVDGIALAIELAAARTKLFTPEALLTRLDEQLSVLKGTNRDVSSRQMTLKNTIEWSYDLLQSNEKTLLNRLAVFAGGFTLEAAQQVCDPNSQLNVDHSLQVLLENNLIQERQTEDLEDFRFYMLSLISEFAYNQLKSNQEAQTLRDQHTDYFLKLAERNSDKWWSTGAGSAIDSIKREDANLRAALDWSSDKDDNKNSIRIIAACVASWAIHSPLDQVKSKVEQIIGGMSQEKSVDPGPIADGLVAAACMSLRLADFRQIDRYARQILALPTDRVSKRTQSIAWYLLGAAKYVEKDFDSVPLALERASELAKASGTVVISNWSKILLAQADLGKGRYQEAQTILTELIPQLDEVGDVYSIAVCHGTIGQIAIRENRPQRAFPHIVKALEICADNHLIHVLGGLLINAATVLQQQGALLLAVQILAETELLCKEQGIETTTESHEREQTLTNLRNSLSKQEFDKAWQEGQKLSLDQTIELIVNERVVEATLSDFA